MKNLNKYYIPLFLIALVFSRCDDNKEIKYTKGSTLVFRSSEKNLVFSLEIDDDFCYYDSLIKSDNPVGFPIGKIVKKKDSSLIHLRINSYDTTFKFALFQVDSILFGLRAKNKFYIITNKNKNAWLVD